MEEPKLLLCGSKSIKMKTTKKDTKLLRRRKEKKRRHYMHFQKGREQEIQPYSISIARHQPEESDVSFRLTWGETQPFSLVKTTEAAVSETTISEAYLEIIGKQRQ